MRYRVAARAIGTDAAPPLESAVISLQTSRQRANIRDRIDIHYPYAIFRFSIDFQNKVALMAIHRGDRWTPEEEEHLRRLIVAKTSPTIIAAKLRRSLTAIRMRIIVLEKKSARRNNQEPKSE